MCAYKSKKKNQMANIFCVVKQQKVFMAGWLGPPNE